MSDAMDPKHADPVRWERVNQERFTAQIVITRRHTNEFVASIDMQPYSVTATRQTRNDALAEAFQAIADTLRMGAT